MKNIFFSVIVPNYNNATYLEQSLKSILNQTFTDYELIVIDDVSTDSSVEVIKNILEQYPSQPSYLIELKNKAWNGGSRNCGIKKAIGKYILFLDSDDWFEDKNCFQTIYDKIITNNYPDCVNISYNCLIGDNKSPQIMERNTQQLLVESCYVACWTKCIKRELVQLFPENTLMEDVVEHIHTCDNIHTIVTIKEPLIVWNRNNVNSCSKEENQNCQNGKWQSSMYRYAADLMDLQLQSPCCEEHRKWRLSIVLNNIKEGKYIQ